MESNPDLTEDFRVVIGNNIIMALFLSYQSVKDRLNNVEIKSIETESAFTAYEFKIF